MLISLYALFYYFLYVEIHYLMITVSLVCGE